MRYLLSGAVAIAILFVIRRLFRNQQNLSTDASGHGVDTDRGPDGPSSDDDGPPISIVALMTERPFLDVDVLKRCLETDFQINFDQADDASETDDASENHGSTDKAESAAELRFADGNNFVMTTPMGTYMVRLHGHMHGVIAHDDVYFEDLDAAIDSVRDLRGKQALEAHRCWMAVDHIGDLPEAADLKDTYARLGRLLLSIVDPTLCTAILLPHAEKFYPWRDDMVEALSSGDVLEELQEAAHVPVASVAPDDPEMLAAVATARERWPEFATAYETQSGQAFGVKFELAGDDEESVEFPWMEVTAIHGEIIQGRLANEPIGRDDLHEGSKVTTRLGELNDWLYVDSEGEQQGGFTIAVLMRDMPPSDDESESK